MKNVAVFCGSSEGNDPDFLSQAYALGKYLALKNHSVIYGGAKIGLMGAVANGALDAGGQAIGVIPDFLKTKEVVHDSLTELHTVSTMHERKTKMSELADGFIVLPGGFGTMEEFFEILTWAQLGLHSKPIGILNINGYYKAIVDLYTRMLKDGLITGTHLKMILTDEDIAGLYAQMINYDPPKVKNWLEESKRT